MGFAFLRKLLKHYQYKIYFFIRDEVGFRIYCTKMYPFIHKTIDIFLIVIFFKMVLYNTEIIFS